MEIEIRKYLRVVKRWWWLLVVSAVIPMAVSYYFTSEQPDLYQAKATVMVGANLQNPDPDPWQMNLANTLVAAYAELIRQGPFVEAVIERLGLERTPEQLAAQIGTRIYSGAQLLEIQVTDTNPQAAALIANALADELIRRSPASGGSDPEQQEFIRGQLEELQAKIGTVSGEISDLIASLAELRSAAEIQDAQDRIAALEEAKSTYQATYAGLLDSYRAESPNVVSLFDPAVVPQRPIPNKTKSVVAVAGAAGLGLALGAIFLMEYLDTSLRWEGDGVQSLLELPVLGAIPQVSRKRAVLSGSPLSPVAEGIRALRASVFLMRPDRPFRTLLLTSPGDSEGKSFVLANLALVLASAGNRVIAVDADMRKPSLHELFDRPNVRGLADVLGSSDVDGGNPLSVPLQDTGFEHLYLLSAGRHPVDPNALLTSPRFPTLLEFLSGRGDVILIDSPPVLGAPDATVLATLAEGTILVVSVGLTKQELVRQAGDRLLAQQGVNLLGLVVNRIKLRRGYYDYSPGPESRESKRKRRSKDSDGDWLTLGEAAEHLGISKEQALRWCKSERLPAVRKGLWWRVDRDEFEHMLEETRKIGMEA
jgi:succinoglycan biosynthesis transport protein ExoP